MAKVDFTKLGEELGVPQEQVDVALAELERRLGYPICGTTEPEERIFKWTPDLWHKVHPMYASPTQIVLVSDSQEETVTDYQLGQNGQLFGTWFNAFKLCKYCQISTLRCTHFTKCDYVKVTAKWGFGEPESVEESGEEESTLCVIPDDLYRVLKLASKKTGDSKEDIQSEGTGTRNYSKFAGSNKTVWEKYSDVINFYRLRTPRFR